MRIVFLLWLALFSVLACGDADNAPANDDDDGCALESANCPDDMRFDAEACACVLRDPPPPNEPPPTDPCDDCGEDQICEEGRCIDYFGERINPDDLEGLSFVFPCLLDGHTKLPPGTGTPWGPLGCDFPQIGFSVTDVSNGGATLELEGHALTQSGEYDPTSSEGLSISTGDFIHNPLLKILADGAVELEIEGIVLRLFDLEMTGVVQPDLLGMEEGTFHGFIDPAPLEEVLGSDPCELIPGRCNDDGLIELLVVDLEAIRVDD